MKRNIAVVGCGHWGKNLVRNFADLGVLACVCDPNLDLAERFALQYEVHNLSFEEILADSAIEALVLSVPAQFHASLAIQGMKAGKHIFVEKPLAMNAMEADQMIFVAKEEKVHLMVGHLLQYHPIFLVLKDMVRSGELGDLSYIYSNRLSFGKVRSEEDVIWSFAPHDISMILSLTDEEVDMVRTESAIILQDGIADIATVHIEFQSGLKSHVAVSWLHPFKEQRLVVVGSKSMAVFDDSQPWAKKLSLYRHGIDLSHGKPRLNKSNVEYVDAIESEPLKNECQYFIDLIAGHVNPRTDGAEGLRVLKVLSAASLSQSEGVAVGVDAL